MQKIILDFDHTLFDTSVWRDALFHMMNERGVSREYVEETYRTLLSERGGNYDFSLHAEIVGRELSPEEREELAIQYTKLDFEKFLYPETYTTLETLSRERELWILSKGIPRMQEEKLKRSGLKELVSERVVIVPFDKVAALHEMKPASGDIFVNDHLEETIAIAAAFPLLRCFLRKRNDCTYSPVPPDGITYINDLTALLDV